MKTDKLSSGFTMFENHPLNRCGSYTISFTTTDCHVQAGFGYAVFPITAATFRTMSNIDCQARTLIGHGTHVSNMSRSMCADCTLTLIYNPAAGTIHVHGAYNREPEILLRKDIPVGETPHRPYINMTAGGDDNPKVTLVPNPRAGL